MTIKQSKRKATKFELPAEVIQLQRLINSGEIWKFEGSAGRAAMFEIRVGNNMCASTPCRDYWGNLVPSRDMVKPGTQGSRGRVVEANGEDYAAALEAVP